MELKIFWQPECPNCPAAKELGDMLERSVKISYFNIKEAGGLAESIFWGIMSTPSMVLVKDGAEIATWRGMTPTIEQIKAKL